MKVALLLCVLAAGCGGSVVTIDDPTADGTSDFWVCDGHNAGRDVANSDEPVTACRGEAGDTDPAGYQNRTYIVGAPKECPNGVSKMDVVFKGKKVQHVRYECAQPRAATDLPNDDASDSSGLPPSVPVDGEE